MNSEKDFTKLSYEQGVVFHLVELIFRGCQQTHVCLTISGPPQVASGYFPEAHRKLSLRERTSENFSPEEYSGANASKPGLLDLHTDIRTSQKWINKDYG